MASALTRRQSCFWEVQIFEHNGYLGIRAAQLATLSQKKNVQ